MRLAVGGIRLPKCASRAEVPSRTLASPPRATPQIGWARCDSSAANRRMSPAPTAAPPTSLRRYGDRAKFWPDLGKCCPISTNAGRFGQNYWPNLLAEVCRFRLTSAEHRPISSDVRPNLTNSGQASAKGPKRRTQYFVRTTVMVLPPIVGAPQTWNSGEAAANGTENVLGACGGNAPAHRSNSTDRKIAADTHACTCASGNT